MRTYHQVEREALSDRRFDIVYGVIENICIRDVIILSKPNKSFRAAHVLNLHI
jgi:hypothetical protein